jgi:hypothetical protein
MAKKQEAKITPIIKVNGVEMNEQEFKELKKKNKKKKMKTNLLGSVRYNGKVLHRTEFIKPSENLFLFGKKYDSSFEFSAGAKDNEGKKYKIFWVFLPDEKNIYCVKPENKIDGGKLRARKSTQKEKNYEQESHQK